MTDTDERRRTTTPAQPPIPLAAGVTSLSGAAALPRQNGELVFEAPWQGRALGMALAIVERLGLDWREFQQRLSAAIAARPDAPYYESWVAALEALLVDRGVVSAAEIAQALRAIDASPP